MIKKLLLFSLFLSIISKAQIYDNVLSYRNGHYNPINNGIKIKTNIPFVSQGEMATINIEGTAYGQSKTLGIIISWYIFNDIFYPTSSVSSYGGYTPKITLAAENGKVVIFIDDKTYFLGFRVKAYSGFNASSTYYQGWTFADEPITGTITKTLEYKNAFGNVMVNGKLEAKEIKVTLTPTADFVFEENYNLPKLEDIEKHIKEKKHLPEIASAKEMEKEGLNVGDFQIKLLQKIEELTLYIIDLNKEVKQVKKENQELKNALQTLSR